MLNRILPLLIDGFLLDSNLFYMERTVAEILYRLPGFEHIELTPNDLPLLREAACPICILDFEPGCVLTRTPCEHVFHYHCLLPAFFDSNPL